MTVQWDKTFGDIPVRVRKVVAVKLYDNIRKRRATRKNQPDAFPYDTNEKSSADKRKIWGRPYHLWSRGAAFVGDEKVVGRYFKGSPPGRSRKTISIIFSNKKQQRNRVFDYADSVLGEEMEFLASKLTRSEINNVILEALQEVW